MKTNKKCLLLVRNLCPDIYGIYDVTVSGDTMQVHYFDWEGREINTTFNRYTGDEVPLP